MQFHRIDALPIRMCAIFALALMVSGCGGSSETDVEPAGDSEQGVPKSETPRRAMSVAELRQKLGANQNAQFATSMGEIYQAKLYQSGVKDISALAGLGLRELDLGGVPVSNIDVLKDMPLENLILEDTQVADLSILRGMPLQELMLQNTKVSDLEPLAGMKLSKLNLMNTPVSDIEIVKTFPLNTLWIPGTQVSDLSPLAALSLESLDIQDTPVKDALVFRGMDSLRRLNIAGSAITDLSPLAGLQLQRLVFTPERIRNGMDIVRGMSSLTELGTSFETRMSPAEFWKRVDSGTLQQP
ncbi:MAG: leucine-rich repeat domain-containing protein [Planctomycetaceae bacterium]